VFRRDCLRLDFDYAGTPLSIFASHFKSMHGGRWETRAVRQQEALAVRKLIERAFPKPENANWLICGDLNDFLEQDGRPDTGHALGPLVDDGFAVDALMMSDLPAMDRWTHHYPTENSYSALDHILLSPVLAEKNARPEMSITRCGLPWRAERFTGFRLPGIAWSNPKASDHCPLSIELNI
jgi:endonuclease/exonuclease/phosphatase family metal-dependent hydrolase